ncbi:MAG: glycosyltransferase [Geobacter sp.]|nr:glycosyltransferase [Geobacter sp.]
MKLRTDRMPCLHDFLTEILAVVVLYRRSSADAPTLQTLGNLLATSGTPLDLFIHDNSPGAHPADAAAALFRIEYHHDPTNPGVARAYNRGAQHARERGKKWLLLLDQDTSFPVDALQRYADAVAANPGISLFAPRLFADGVLCSPCAYAAGIGRHLRSVDVGPMRLQGRGILNSGMLIRLDAFEEIGGFDERIPLDFADHDFCRRFARRFGQAYILDMDCGHGFSDREDTSLASALARFAFFCQGARNSIRTPLDLLTHPLAALARCMRLSLRYRTFRFLPLLVRGMIGGTGI